MYPIILKFFFRGLCDCPPQSLYTCGRCDEVLPPDQLGKALSVLHESCRNNNVRVHVWSMIYLILLVRSGPVQSGPVWFGLVRSGSERPWFGRSDRTLIWRRLATRISWKRPLLNVLSDSCRNNKVRVHVWSPFIVPFWLFLTVFWLFLRVEVVTSCHRMSWERPSMCSVMPAETIMFDSPLIHVPFISILVSLLTCLLTCYSFSISPFISCNRAY